MTGLPRVVPLLALACLLALTPSANGGSRRATGARADGASRARAAASFMTGIGDEQREMFGNPLWQQLHTRIARYIAPYDAAVRGDELGEARAWIGAAEAAHEQILIAFYHSRHTPTKLPSVSVYQSDVAKFLKDFPRIHQFQSWDESNRGQIRNVLASPSAAAAARYYQALLRVCHGCTVVGLDVLDAADISPTLQYISEFKREIARLRTVMPKIWGLHNYSDVNRQESWRTHDLVKALGGQVWLTETGGIVQLDPYFPNRHGEGLTRAAKVLHFMFFIAGAFPQIKRLYIFDWSGGHTNSRFDAGLTDDHFHPRPGYIVVCKALGAAHCAQRVSHH